MLRHNSGSSLELGVFFYAWMIHRSELRGLTNRKTLSSENNQVQELDWKWVKKQQMSKENLSKPGELLLKSTLKDYKKEPFIVGFLF